MWRRVIAAAVLLVLLVIGLRSAAAYAIRFGVRLAFEKGTGSEVSIGRPSISFFPPSGEIRDIVLRRADEPPEDGFKVDRLRVTINLLSLFSKHAQLPVLELHGATAGSHGTESSFFKTIDFCVTPPAPSSGPRRWHSFITGGWKASVDRVIIGGPEKSHSDLVMHFGPHGMRFDDVRLDFDIPPGEPPTKTLGSAAKFSVIDGEKEQIVGALFRFGALL